MSATVAQNPYNMGAFGVESVMTLINGGSLDPVIDTGNSSGHDGKRRRLQITAENAPPRRRMRRRSIANSARLVCLAISRLAEFESDAGRFFAQPRNWLSAIRAKSPARWRASFIDARRRYLKNSSDVHLYGVLIRDVAPHEDDLRMPVMQFCAGCPEGTRIEFLALHLPNGRISSLGC